jgi:glycosyltransferase involved in cell wall biosynthesis
VFREAFINKLSLWYFTDFNLDFVTKMRSITRRENIDIIIISFPRGVIVSKLCVKTPIILDSHGIESEFSKFAFPNMPKLIQMLIFFWNSVIERVACKVVDRMMVLSSRDKSKYMKDYGTEESKISVVPPFKEKIQRNDKFNRKLLLNKIGVHDGIICVFHGIYNHYPNLEAIQQITNYIAPKIYQLDKKIIFLIFGKGVPEIRYDNIIQLGYIDDLQMLYFTDLAIMPILSGAGVRIKALDYLMAGLPIISTSKGVEGLDIKSTEAIVLKTVNQDFINAITSLANNPIQRKELGKRAKHFYHRKFSPERSLLNMQRLLQHLTIR